MNGRKPALIAAGVLALALVLAFFAGALFGDETFVERDLLLYYRPAKSLVAPLVHASGGLPLWNPYFASGQPFAANPEHEIFHPLTWLFLLLGFEWAFRLQVILPLLAAGPAMYALLRSLRRSRWAALLGAVAWAAGGYLLSTTNLIPILLAVVMLPLVMLFCLRLSRRARLRDVLGAVVSFGLMILAGEPSTLIMTAPLLAAALWSRRSRPTRRGLVRVAGTLALGTALGAATLLPALHHAGKTVRANGLPASQADHWSMPPVRIAELFVPPVLGHPDHRDPARYWGDELYPERKHPFLYSLYPGLLVGVLAAFAIRARWRSLLPWLLVAATGYLVAVGTHLPLWSALRRLPMLAGLRFPEKFSLLFVFPWVIMAAEGADLLRVRAGRRAVSFALGAVGAAAALAMVGVLVGADRLSDRSRMLEVIIADLSRVAFVGLACALVVRHRARFGVAGFGAVLCGLLAMDLGMGGKELLRTTPIEAVARTPAYLQPIAAEPERHLLFDRAAFDERAKRGELLRPPPGPAEWRVPTTLEVDFDLTNLRWTNRSLELFWDAVEADGAAMSRLLHRRGVTAFTRVAPGARWEGERLALPGGRTTPIELLDLSRQARPFSFAAAQVEVVDGDDGWLASVSRLGPAVTSAVIIDRAELPVLPAPPAAAKVEVIERKPTRVSLHIEGEGPGPSMVAINQTWDDGWRATVDGEPARLLRADIALSAVLVPPGRHQLVLKYTDPWVGAGLAISAATLLLLVAFGLLARARVRGFLWRD